MLTRLITAIRAAWRRLANKIRAARGGGQGEE